MDPRPPAMELKKCARRILRCYTMCTKFFLVGFIIMTALSAGAANEGYTFTYQGYVTNTADVPQPSLAGTFIFQIYDPSGTCLLYEETQGATSDTSAMVSLRVGSPTGDPKRSGGDPNLSMGTIYTNGASI